MLTPYNYASNSPAGQLDIDGMQNPQQTESAGGDGSSKGGDNASKDSTNSGGTDQNSVMHGNDKSETINAYSIEHGEIKFDPIIIDDGKTLETNPEESFNAAKSELQKILPKLPSEESTMETIETEDPGMIDYEPQEQTKEEKKSFFNTVYSVVSHISGEAKSLFKKGGQQLARVAKFAGNVAKGFGFIGVGICLYQTGLEIDKKGWSRETITKGVIGFSIAVLSISFPIVGFLAIAYAFADDKGYIDKWIQEFYKGLDMFYYQTSHGLYELSKGRMPR